MKLACVALMFLIVAFPQRGHGQVAESNADLSDNPPAQVDMVLQERLRQGAKQQQEQTRKRLFIPDAVDEGITATPEAVRAVTQHTAPPRPRPAGMSRTGVILSLTSCLAVILAIRKVVPGLFETINRRFNPWAASGSAERKILAKVRAEEEAFSEFLTAFQAGPGAAASETTTEPQIEEEEESAAEPPAASEEFYARAEKLLAAQQQLLQEIGRASDDTARQKLFKYLLCELSALKGEPGSAALLHVWQLAAALEGLLKQLTEKTRNITPSTIRSVAGAVELLNALCRPGVKRNLLKRGPLRLLAVDDDPISRTALSNALRRAFNEPDVAVDPNAALALTVAHAYDVIFLDVQMPGMDGFELCSKIHETATNHSTPVVFVTGQDDFDARARSAAIGGNDLIGKPFLSFEVTVKALTLGLRSRLGQGVAVQLAPATPLTETVNLESPEATDEAEVSLQPEDGAGALDTTLAIEEPTTAEEPVLLETETTSFTTAEELAGSEFAPGVDEIATEFLTRASAHLRPLQASFESIFQTDDEGAQHEILKDIYLRIHSFTPDESLSTAHPAMQVSMALQGLLRKLLEKPGGATASTLVTAAAGADLLSDLCGLGLQAEDTINPPIRLLVVDDDPIACRSLTCALQMAFERPESVDSGAAALAVTSKKPFDVIFLDVQMPGMDGFAACSKIRESGPNRSTPIVFVTARNDFSTRSQMSVCGGNDFVGKPFLNSEITVKALIHGLRNRLEKREATAV